MFYPLCPKNNIRSDNFQYTGPPEQGVRVGVSPLTQSSLLMCPFLLMSSLNVLFLKEVTKNVHENQQAESRAS